MDVNFADRLKNVKYANGYTTKEMADLLGMSKRMYEYYEKGECKGTENRIGKYLHRLEQLEKGLNVVNNIDSPKAQESASLPKQPDTQELIDLLKHEIELLKKGIDILHRRISVKDQTMILQNMVLEGMRKELDEIKATHKDVAKPAIKGIKAKKHYKEK